MSCTINECPTSFISADSIRLVEEYASAKTAHRAFGAIPYGADSRKHPAFWVDAVEVLEHAENEIRTIQLGQE